MAICLRGPPRSRSCRTRCERSRRRIWTVLTWTYARTRSGGHATRLSAYVNDYVRRATDDPVTIGRRLESRIEDLVDEIADLRAQLHAPQRSHADDGASVGGVASALSGVPGTTTIAPGYSPPIGGPVTMAKARMEAPTDPDGVYQMTPREPTQKVVAASMDER